MKHANVAILFAGWCIGMATCLLALLLHDVLVKDRRPPA